jgi:division protein CdvB (Snf7/Vps24/ESCRT-III family)
MITAEKLRFIFEHYGEENQLIQLKEELNELIDEINYILRVVKPYGNNEFLGEVADVLVLCEQFRLKYNKVNIIKDYKINRQISRIKESIERSRV